MLDRVLSLSIKYISKLVPNADLSHSLLNLPRCICKHHILSGLRSKEASEYPSIVILILLYTILHYLLSSSRVDLPFLLLLPAVDVQFVLYLLFNGDVFAGELDVHESAKASEYLD